MSVRRRFEGGAEPALSMRLGVFVLSLVSLTVLGLWTVEERARALRMAYELGELEEQIRARESENRLLRLAAAAAKSPAALRVRNVEMKLQLEEPSVGAGHGD